MSLQNLLEQSWENVLHDEFSKPYFIRMEQFLLEEYTNSKIFPAWGNIFNAFNLCPFDNVKVVILGQDPYHDDDQAHGLCFSVRQGIKAPPSLKNIFKELESDLGITLSTTDLTEWAKQGVLLLNSVLTVEAHNALSHSLIGWAIFTNKAIEKLASLKEKLVFLLWGNQAKQKFDLVNNGKHNILLTSHPSPLSAYQGFLGCKHFSKTNEILKSVGCHPIEWKI